MLPASLSPNVRPTKRGLVVGAVSLVAIIMALIGGPRALNAVVVPGLVALGAAYLQLFDLERPRAVRTLPPDDHEGASHELRLRFTDESAPTGGVSKPFVATVIEHIDDGLSISSPMARVTVGADEVSFSIEYERRGERSIGPTELIATDVLGLLERDFVCEGTDHVLVYPRRHPVPSWFRRGLYETAELGRSRQRDEFDRLREYVPGDSLRDIHWPTTAKRDELIVKEFVADVQTQTVSISVGGSGADRSATAAASVAGGLLDDGVPIRLSAPNGQVEVFPGAEPRKLQELLARMPRGDVPEPDADIVIQGTHRQTQITTGEETYRFKRLREEASGGPEPYPGDSAPGRDERAGVTDGTEPVDSGQIVTDGGKEPFDGGNFERGYFEGSNFEEGNFEEGYFEEGYFEEGFFEEKRRPGSDSE